MVSYGMNNYDNSVFVESCLNQPRISEQGIFWVKDIGTQMCISWVITWIITSSKAMTNEIWFIHVNGIIKNWSLGANQEYSAHHFWFIDFEGNDTCSLIIKCNGLFHVSGYIFRFQEILRTVCVSKKHAIIIMMYSILNFKKYSTE